MSRSPSTDAILSRDINMRELQDAEARGVGNKTFSEIYEEYNGNPRDLENGVFMVENPQQALRKNDQDYLEEVKNRVVYVTCSKADSVQDPLTNNVPQNIQLIKFVRFSLMYHCSLTYLLPVSLARVQSVVPRFYHPHQG